MPVKTLEIPFPLKGVHQGASYAYQPDLTSPDALNVRTYDVAKKRARGGKRSGLSKLVATQFGDTGGSPIQGIGSGRCRLVTSQLSPLPTVAPVVTGNTALYFNSSTNYSAGVYRVYYDSGCMQYDSDDPTGEHVSIWSVNDFFEPQETPPFGFKVLKNGDTPDLAGNGLAAPGTYNGFPTQAGATGDSDGQFIEFTHTGGTIGVYLWDDPTADNLAGTTSPTFRLEKAPTGNFVDRIVLVSYGIVYIGSTTSIAAATNASGSMITSGDVRMAELFSKMYLVDGTNYKVLDLTTGVVTAWAATSGDLPAVGTNKAKLICLWRGRLMLSGVLGDDHNWFASRMGDALDFAYSPVITDPTEAVSGNNAPYGKIGDRVTAMMPFNDDNLVFGCARSIWMMRGDPCAGGKLDIISDGVGCMFGTAYAKSPDGALYFMGTNGVYRLTQDGALTNVSSGRLDLSLAGVDESTYTARLAWDVLEQQLHVYLTLNATGASTHYYYDPRADAFWPVTYPDAVGPTAAYSLYGDQSSNRLLLLGGRTGYVYKVDASVYADDGTAINAYVVYPPVRLGHPEYNSILMRVAPAFSSSTTGVSMDVRAGTSAESVLSETATWTRTWATSNRQTDVRDRARGSVLSIKLYSNDSTLTWATETIMADVAAAGRVRA